jgi:hypothetical protein
MLDTGNGVGNQQNETIVRILYVRSMEINHRFYVTKDWLLVFFFFFFFFFFFSKYDVASVRNDTTVDVRFSKSLIKLFSSSTV